MEHLLQIFSHLTDSEWIAKYKEYLILIILTYSFIEVIFPPLPGDTLLILSGSISLAAKSNPLWIILAAFIGTFGGSVLLYNLGGKMERKLLNSPRFSWMLDSKTFLKIDHGFKAYGFWIILGSRLLPVARSGIILAAGMVNMEKRRSLAAVAISILIASTLLVFGGRFLGRRLQQIIGFWHERFKWILLVAVFAVILYLCLAELWKKYQKGR